MCVNRRRLCVKANTDQVEKMAALKAENEKKAREREERNRRVEKQLSQDGSKSEKGEFDDWANPLGL